MTAVTDELVEKVRAVLVAEGADSEGGWHSWRCFDMVRYPESCDCTEQVARAAVEAVAALIAREAWNDAVAEAHACGWLHSTALADMIARNPHG